MNMRFHRLRLDGLIGTAFILVMLSGLTLLGWSSHGWNALHHLSSAVLLLGVLVHVPQHWKWIQQVLHLGPKPPKVRRHLWIDGTLLLLFLLVLASAEQSDRGGSALLLHAASGLAMAAMVTAHLVVHRTWIVSTWGLYRNRTSDTQIPVWTGRKPSLFGD